MLYNPKTFFTHAALLDQAFAHCPIFPTAASRRSLGRVSVPVWLIILSDQLSIIALVGLYPTNKLIERRLLHRRLAPLTLRYHAVLAPVSRCYPPPVDRSLRDTHPSATHPERSVRLACVKHAASVRSEPGSNSQVQFQPAKANQNQTIDPETKKLTSVVLSKKNKSVSTLIIRTTGSDNTKAPPTYPFHTYSIFKEPTLTH